MTVPAHPLSGSPRILATIAAGLWLGACGSPAPEALPDAESTAREVTWGELVPEGAKAPELPATAWDPDFESYDLLAAQPIARDANAALSGERVRLPGFIVPLDHVPGKGITEFLLVPWFGACIHSPPPPANQTVHVTAVDGERVENLLDAVWVTGIMEARLKDSAYGQAAYTLQAERIEPYDES